MTGMTIRSFCNRMSFARLMIVAGIATCSALLSPHRVQGSSVADAKKAAADPPPNRYQPNRFAGRAGKYYSLIWGIDSLRVKAVESGELIRFSYQVIDPGKALPLHDKKIEPKLIDPVNHLILAIPSLEKVGQLRQVNSPEAGRSYWMAFSNPHRTVKRGDKVNVIIGQFHADGLVVE